MSLHAFETPPLDVEPEVLVVSEVTSTLVPAILTNEDAAELVRAYQKGLAARKRLTSKADLSDKSRATARVATQNGERAAQKLVESMLKLCTRIVREIAEARHGRDGAGPLMDDLLSEANISVLEAAKTFDPSKEVAFNRWAAQQVRNTIRSQVMEDNSAGLKVFSSWSRMRRRAIPERQDLAAKLGREPTMTELKAHMLEVCLGWAYEHLRPDEQLLPADRKREVAISKLRKQGTLSALENLEDALNAGASPIHLDTPVGGNGVDGGSSWGSLLPAEGSASHAHDQVATKELQKVLMQSLQALTQREQTILLYRFGFVDGEVWTYRAIGDMFNISAERVRQIEERTREFLREKSEFSNDLWGHLHPDH